MRFIDAFIQVEAFPVAFYTILLLPLEQKRLQFKILLVAGLPKLI